MSLVEIQWKIKCSANTLDKFEEGSAAIVCDAPFFSY